jgi:hypothetical protein
LSLSNESTASQFGFKCNLHRYSTAHASAALQRLAAAADIQWDAISALEDVLAAHLKSVLAGGETKKDDGGKERGAEAGGKGSKSGSMWSVLSPAAGAAGGGDGESSLGKSIARGATVGGAAVFGGALLFLTGGMAAPALVASLASLGAAGVGLYKLNPDYP